MSVKTTKLVPRLPKTINSDFEVHWACTNTKTYESTDSIIFSWTIKNFKSLISKSNEELLSSITSPSFSSKKNKTISWNLSVNPMSVYSHTMGEDTFFERLNNDDKGFLPIRLTVSSRKEKFQIQANFYFAILNDNDEEIGRTDFTYLFKSNGQTTYDCPKFISLKILTDKRQKLLKNDNLTVICSIKCSISGIRKYTEECEVIEVIEGHNNEIKQKSNSQILKKLHLHMNFSDVTIVVDNKELKAHKCVLAAASPVFSEILKDGLSEPKKIININNFKYETVRQFLNFIYTEKVENLSSTANQLYLFSHKYKVNELQVFCESYLSKHINLENCVDSLLMAEEYNSKKLKEAATNFILSKKEAVVETSKFKEASKSHPSLIIETLLKSIRLKE